VSLALQVHEARSKVPPELDEQRAELSRTASELEAAVDDLHEISRGIHPAILSDGGSALHSGLFADEPPCRPSWTCVATGGCRRRWEIAAYYVVSEALTNVAKHAGASLVCVAAKVRADSLQLAIHDDGAGGADPRRGSGLVGLRDRVDALGGTLSVESPVGAGTSLLVALPLR
jgi:signal transduction histidine kinase